MQPTFDIFKENENGDLIWRGASETFEEAKLKGKTLADTEAEFVIFNQRTQERTTIKPEGEASPSPGTDV